MSALKWLVRFHSPKGRSPRRTLLVMYILQALAIAPLMVATFSSEIDSYDWGDALRLLLPVLILAPASWMVVIRRFHDMDRSGFWILLAFVPIVNYVWWLWPLLASGTEGPNKYGGRSSNA